MTYYNDYETEPIGRGNPYSRCMHCKRSVPEINGNIKAHEPDCLYRQAIESGQPYRPYSEEKMEPIGGGNPYRCCVYCKRSEPEINGRIEGHDPWCKYRLSHEHEASTG